MTYELHHTVKQPHGLTTSCSHINDQEQPIIEPCIHPTSHTADNVNNNNYVDENQPQETPKKSAFHSVISVERRGGHRCLFR